MSMEPETEGVVEQSSSADVIPPPGVTPGPVVSPENQPLVAAVEGLAAKLSALPPDFWTTQFPAILRRLVEAAPTLIKQVTDVVTTLQRLFDFSQSLFRGPR